MRRGVVSRVVVQELWVTGLWERPQSGCGATFERVYCRAANANPEGDPALAKGRHRRANLAAVLGVHQRILGGPEGVQPD